jgi:DNA-binding response OmpR family regulator
MKVLVIDDDLALSDVIAFTLRRAGFEVLTAYDGQSGYDRWLADLPDLVVLDIKLPLIDGLTLCKRIRTQRSTPVIILSVQGADEDVVHGLDIGADDYLAKPFSPAQLVARIKAVLRRTGLTPVSGDLTTNDLTLDVSRREVKHAGQVDPISLTALEARLLEVLMLNKGQVLPIETLISHVWGVDGGDRVMLKQLVHRLRQKIDIDMNPADPAASYVENVPGVGYALLSRAKGRSG